MTGFEWGENGYGYNDRGEVKAGNRKWSDTVAVASQQFGYGFDTIGNRTGTVANGRSAIYGADAGNRLTTREVPGAVDVHIAQLLAHTAEPQQCLQ